jgi:cytochrome c biogenesis protein CcmG/thiol:disulfide interchange protein DsbE
MVVSKIALVPAGVFAFFGILLLAAAGERPGEAQGQGYLDRPLPEFRQPPLSAGAPGLSAKDIRGDVALINVFASWCAVCRSEHPTLLRLAAEEGVPIYGLNWKDAAGAGSAYLRQLGDPYRAVGEDAGGELGDRLSVTGVPETLVVDAEGRIRYRHVGALTEQVWQDVIGPLVHSLRGRS